MSAGREFEERVLYNMSRCKHFNGIQHDACLAGVDYRTFKPNGIPCIPRHTPAAPIAGPCSKKEHRTREEAEADEKAIDAHIEQFLSDIRAGLCPQCRKPVERKSQVGPCIYAEPCGHRLGQGRAAR